ncbi:hypothetical protein CaCOL14_011743 [Colletotrichum acutatum]|uniref:NACHT domain-containing protein n=1 Tax=Glomerella acutata TaxID=27357 RepID=A0AAD8XJZ7_GLOAC|nr:uncharacterized protein BDZ83DRAFT_609398 [Colletotrichum acutatum]KAK1728490.1 hypothetical protein BDZ83DRAFT_609398 [Colletotrichum acutatum]
MTPLEIIGLVSAIITFIDFAAENVAVAREIGLTGSATFKDNADLERRVKLVEEHVTGLNARTIGAARDTDEAHLLDLIDEYKRLTVQLMTLLAGLKLAKKRYILCKMIKDFRKKDEKETLQKGLNDCRSRIHLQLTQLTRSELSGRLGEISAQGHVSAIEMQQLGANIKELQSNVELWKHVPGLVESVHDILSRSKEAVEGAAQRLILEKLYVGDMTRRFDEIERAHEKTFSWLLGLNTSSIGEADPSYASTFRHSDGSGYKPQISLKRTVKELQAQKCLVNWLAHGGGIFHISGKPGAGKSTLMKYLCQSTATQSYLNDWAGEKRLISANFFFWKLGSTAQKSLDGLLRALSYSVLEQAPVLLETVFPNQWINATQGRAFSIQSSEIESAFSRLLQQTAFFSSHKIAIFIDGLDEFDGDHDNMIKMLRSWAESLSEDIKLCVSSREWEVFRKRLVNCPGILLQDITSRDIAAYVNSELCDNEEFRSYYLENPNVEKLIDLIKDKAKGVFLWVKITLRGLKWGFLSGERLEDLRARLEALPAGLGNLFASILASIRSGIHTNKLDRMRAMRMLLLVAEQTRGGLHALPLLLAELTFLDDYEKDPNFVFSFPTANGANSARVSRQDRARRSVYQRCMGLLEVQLSEHDSRPRLMRGVCDFSDGQAKQITSREENKYKISENLNTEIENSLQNGTARIHQEENSEIIDEGDAIFLHTHAWYYDNHRINHEHPSTERVVCTHRSVVEFLLQPHIKSLIDAEAQSFDWADFRLQAFLASLKLFDPCKGFVKKGLGHVLKHFVENCFHFRGLAQGRLLTSCEELIRTLEVQTPTPSIGSEARFTNWFRFDPSELVYATETDGSIGLAVHIDPIAYSWPINLDGGFYQLGRRSKREMYHNVLLDFCLYEISHFYLARDVKKRSYELRTCEYISKCFEAGADPNGASLLKYGWGARFTCWQTWIITSIKGRSWGSSPSSIKLFLLHGADPNIWVHCNNKTVSLWWAGATVWYGVIGSLAGRDMGKFRSQVSHIGAGSGKAGVDLLLGEFLPLWFPDGAELRELCQRSQESRPTVMPPCFTNTDVVWHY